MLFLGASLIAGAVVSAFPNWLLPVDQYLGTHSSVAGAALGIGIAAAAFNPVANVTWVRIAILYAILDVLFALILRATVGAPFQTWPFIVSIVVGALLIVLYPQREQLLPPREASWRTARTDSTL
jgi:peptidoglycan/LPS O-acetylase OafA/YrhL